jgi:hypothetical protein
MKNFQKLVSLLILLILVSSCVKKTTEFEFEKSVMTEIFPSLVDSICVDSRKMLPPPIVGEFFTDKTGHVKVDSTKATKEQKIEYGKWKNERDKLEKDTSTIIIAFDPFLEKGVFYLNKELKKQYPFLETSIVNNDTVKGYKFDFEKIKLNNKFKIKNISEFPKVHFPNRITDFKYDFVFSGVFYLSRIQFDNKKNVGILEGGFDFCGRCGRWFNIFIKKENNKWVIVRVELTGMS